MVLQCIVKVQHGVWYMNSTIIMEADEFYRHLDTEVYSSLVSCNSMVHIFWSWQACQFT